MNSICTLLSNFFSSHDALMCWHFTHNAILTYCWVVCLTDNCGLLFRLRFPITVMGQNVQLWRW